MTGQKPHSVLILTIVATGDDKKERKKVWRNTSPHNLYGIESAG
jgi:hypothetical protein